MHKLSTSELMDWFCRTYDAVPAAWDELTDSERLCLTMNARVQPSEPVYDPEFKVYFVVPRNLREAQEWQLDLIERPYIAFEQKSGYFYSPCGKILLETIVARGYDDADKEENTVCYRVWALSKDSLDCGRY